MGWGTPSHDPSGAHSHTCPPSPASSHDNHVPHGVTPPAQLREVPSSTE